MMSDQLNDALMRRNAAKGAIARGVEIEVHRALGFSVNQTVNRVIRETRLGGIVALCDLAALAGLLLEKKIIAPEEYAEAIAREMEAEQRRFEERLGVKLK